ncbi:MAG: metallophosphoesterase [Planctomycetia bacterium]|nr:metallophosphoesterase [Planctomycetia bacterium]
MKRALISDLHANLEATEAVLADVRQQGLTDIYCLGDIVGYGPNPRECIDLVIQHCQVCLLGNHDQGALFDPDGFNSVAERAIFWTRQQLEESVGGRDSVAKRWDFLGELPRTYKDGDYLYVHGSPRRPLSEYVFPEDIYNPRKMENLFALVPKYCFQGHTHVPGVFTEGQRFLAPEEINFAYQLCDEKVMVNVGSVGQPRDCDPRACYVVQDDGWVRFRRVEYDVEKTIHKIYATPELDDSLGDRLREGH